MCWMWKKVQCISMLMITLTRSLLGLGILHFPFDSIDASSHCNGKKTTEGKRDSNQRDERAEGGFKKINRGEKKKTLFIEWTNGRSYLTSQKKKNDVETSKLWQRIWIKVKAVFVGREKITKININKIRMNSEAGVLFCVW